MPNSPTWNLNELLLSRKLLWALNEAQRSFIDGLQSREFFSNLLNILLELTHSQFGYIGEVHCDRKGEPYQLSRAISNVAWDDETRKYYEDNWLEGLCFRNLNNLSGILVRTGEVIISNDPESDPRSRGTPPGHPKLANFLGLPMWKQGRLVGTVGLANRPGGYSMEMARFLEPYLSTCASVMEGYASQRQMARDADELKQKDRRQESLLNAMAEGVILQDDRFVIRAINESGERIFGLKAKDIIGRKSFEIPWGTIKEDGSIWPPQDHPSTITLKTGEPCSQVIMGSKLQDGSLRWISVNTRPVFSKGLDKPDSVVISFSDITEHKLFQKKLREKENLIQSIHRTSPIALALAENRVFTWVNQRWLNMFGYDSIHDIIGHSTEVGYESTEEYRRVGQVLYPGLEQKTVSEAEARFKRKDGSLFWGRAWATFLDPEKKEKGVICAIADVTEQKEAEINIEKALKEKTILLQEIHHRVKNNLALIVSMLNLQAGYYDDDKLSRAFNDAQDRIRSMAMAHELLYRSGDLANVGMGQYVRLLTDHLFADEATLGKGPVSLRTEIEDMALPVVTVIPVGFILTELVSNSLKHAFPDGRSGEIFVGLAKKNRPEFEIIVSDNGVGIPEDVDLKNPKSLGLDLVITFVDQLKGRIEVESLNGVTVRILCNATELSQ